MVVVVVPAVMVPVVVVLGCLGSISDVETAAGEDGCCQDQDGADHVVLLWVFWVTWLISTSLVRAGGQQPELLFRLVLPQGLQGTGQDALSLQLQLPAGIRHTLGLDA